MKRFPAPVPLVAALLFAAQAYSQSTTPQRYASALYFSVPGDKQAAFVENWKTGAGAKAMRALMKANPNRTGWSLRQAVYSGYPAQRANYIALSTWNGAPQELEPAKRDEIYRAATGMAFAEYIQKARALSEAVSSTLSHIHHVTPDFQLSEGDLVVSQRLKIAEGKAAELYDLNRDIRLPMATERVKGGNLKGWAFGHLVFPSGGALPWDAVETSVYKDLASALPGPGGGGGGGAGMALFTKLFPNRSFTRYQDDLRETSKLVRRDVQRVVVVIRP